MSGAIHSLIKERKELVQCADTNFHAHLSTNYSRVPTRNEYMRTLEIMPAARYRDGISVGRGFEKNPIQEG